MKRFPVENQCYHVISATRNRRTTFSVLSNAEVLLEALQFTRNSRALLLAYAIMADHFHAVFVPITPYTLSQVMQTVKGFSSRRINAVTGNRGPIWQRSFFDRGIRDETQLYETISYIHGNPVQAGLVAAPEDYRFSSAGKLEGTDLIKYLNG